jgi:predicted CoA-substrate-specific enzyme activase
VTSAGVDIGSVGTKAVVLGPGEALLGSAVIATGYNARSAGETALRQAAAAAGVALEALACVVATGYGRRSLPLAQRAVTEITCHAAGAHYLAADVRTVIDIGGQDSKVIRIGEGGRVEDFAMNDKCAAGTGRFLEVMARALEVDLEAFGSLSRQASRPAAISSICTVFAESEVVSLVAQGAARADIIAGIHAAVASRMVALAGRLGLSPPVMLSGGVARNSGVVAALEERIGFALIVSPRAQLTGAIGAALIAARQG